MATTTDDEPTDELATPRPFDSNSYDEALAACKAALAYDNAIQRYAVKGKSWVGGNDLDDLYADWITKARRAVEGARPRIIECEACPKCELTVNGLCSCPKNECFCGIELEAGLCPNGHDPVARAEQPDTKEG